MLTISAQPDTGLNVLVAEDDPRQASALATYLRLGGHKVAVVPDGGLAVDAALKDPPDVALLDIGLPGLDGWAVARALRRGLRHRPCFIVAVTGFDDPVDRDRSRKAGINLHLRKPADPKFLAELLDTLLKPTIH